MHPAPQRLGPGVSPTPPGTLLSPRTRHPATVRDRSDFAESVAAMSTQSAMGLAAGGLGPREGAAILITELARLRRTVVGQTLSGEAVIKAGAMRDLAAACVGRVAGSPREAAHWYNLGDPLYRRGADGK